MNRLQLLKKLLPSFIPLFVFIIADEVWGTKIGLFVAVGVGVLEMIWIASKEKRFDKFVLIDTLLLVVLGATSILLDSDIFFKLKPGLIQLILVVVLAVSAFSPVNIIGLMGKRYLKNLQLNKVQMAEMQHSLRLLFYIFLAHTILIFYATFYMSKEAWAFISGGLFYIIFGAYFLFELLRQRKKQKQTYFKEEWVPLVDANGKVIGKAPRNEVHNGSKLLHPVVHLHVFSKNGAILLQKRSASKLIQPRKWDTAVGGHISVGETLEEALKKEAFEEIGLVNFDAKLQKTYKWESEVEVELVYMFTAQSHKAFKPKINKELEDARFWTKKQVERNLGNKIFTPNFEYEYRMLQEFHLF